ncbi:hypothetical protein E2C01_033615 [Portunus trituberculatus]|uniref:Uncharacterized protein n=1 Tax=Portunus trituberculatus TaxID=210409 RepID=A0A5B7F0L3_PORTR|nr:hypothetical protein [Portunus trituberculatus]
MAWEDRTRREYVKVREDSVGSDSVRLKTGFRVGLLATRIRIPITLVGGPRLCVKKECCFISPTA